MRHTKEQRPFIFTPRSRRHQPDSEAGWADLVMENPAKYGALVVDLALQAIHRAGRPHKQDECPLCIERKQEYGSR